MEVYLDKNDLSEAQRMLYGYKNGFPKAMSRALNKTVTGIRTDMVSLLRSRYNIKATALRKRIVIVRATYAKLAASATSSGQRIHLTDVAGTRQTKKGVSVDVKKSTGRKLIPSAFIARGQRSGKLMVFRRAESGGKMVGRTPIEARYASYPEELYNTGENWPDLQKAAQKRLDDNFQHEVDVVLKGFA